MKPKQKPQLDPNVKRLFTGTEVGALIENLDGNLKLVLEGQAGLRESHNTLVARVDVLVDTVGEIKVDITELKIDVSELKTNIARVEQKLDRKADRTQVKQLDQRVSLLEAK
jgi:hypothetical protein